MKATVQDVVDLGFLPMQFNSPNDWDAVGGYVERVISMAANIVVTNVGATYYGDAEGEINDSLKNAEVYFAGAELWRRRAAFIASEGVVAGDDKSAVTQKSALESSVTFENVAYEYLGYATPSNTGLSFGHVQSGHYAEV